MGYTNIMHDKRVVRGSNFSKKPFVSVIYFNFLDIMSYYYFIMLFYTINTIYNIVKNI